MYSTVQFGVLLTSQKPIFVKLQKLSTSGSIPLVYPQVVLTKDIKLNCPESNVH